MTLAALTTSIIMFTEPDVLEGIMEGKILGMEITPEILLFAAVERLVPIMMAFLTLALKDSINRWANIAAGTVYTILSLISMNGASPQMILMWASAAVATALIVWYAWKSKPKA